MQYLPECIKAIGSAITGVATAWAFAIIICNGIKMLCITWLASEAEVLDKEECTQLLKIEPVWMWKNTKDVAAKMKNKW